MLKFFLDWGTRTGRLKTTREPYKVDSVLISRIEDDKSENLEDVEAVLKELGITEIQFEEKKFGI
jgi:hexokinase